MFCVYSASENRSYKILILKIIQGFVETLQITPLDLAQTKSTKGTLISKSHTF